jgi:hypothetical protein
MLQTLETVGQRIEAGETLMVAADAHLLRQLPHGNWIGGSIPYFMSERGICSQTSCYAIAAPGTKERTLVRSYAEHELHRIIEDAPDNGYSLVTIPFGSAAHHRFAREAPEYPDVYLKPIVGWVSGVHLDALPSACAEVLDGNTGECRSDVAVALHVELPKHQQALVRIINLFRPGAGDDLTFDTEGFEPEIVRVNGEPRSFAEYLATIGADLRAPLVANYLGTMVNVSFRALDQATNKVQLYAPVFRNVLYRLAAPLTTDYASAYTEAVRGIASPFACSCILNFIHGALQGQPVTGAQGPVTFGEIAHQLLNQTTVTLDILEL